MFLVWSVCLSVCLSVRRITRKLVNRFWRNFLEGWAWLKDQVIQFWWRSGSRFGSGSPKSEIRILRIGAGLCSLSISFLFKWHHWWFPSLSRGKTVRILAVTFLWPRAFNCTTPCQHGSCYGPVSVHLSITSWSYIRSRMQTMPHDSHRL